jgi:hypothetical protein
MPVFVSVICASLVLRTLDIALCYLDSGYFPSYTGDPVYRSPVTLREPCDVVPGSTVLNAKGYNTSGLGRFRYGVNADLAG